MNTNRFDGAVECVTELCLELLAQKEDFVDVELASFRLVSDILRKAIGLALERFDDELFESKAVPGSVKSKERRRVVSLCGEISFCRRRYQEGDSSHLPLDEILTLSPRARLSPAAIFEITSLALDLSYQKTAAAFERISGVRISKPSVGEAIVATASALGFEQESSKKKAVKELMCEADGIWVALQHTKTSRLKAARQGVCLPRKAEVSLAVDYEGKKKDAYGKRIRINPYYHVSLEGKEVLWESVQKSIEARFDTSRIHRTLFATDGEAAYVAGKHLLPGHVTHLYDRWHVFKIVRDLTNSDISPEIISLLCARRLDGALLHLGGYRDAYRQESDFKTAKNIQKLMKFLVKWENEILAGLIYSLGTCEGSNAHVIAARCKRLGRSWSRRRLSALCKLLGHIHSGGQIPKIRRVAKLVLVERKPTSEPAVLPPPDNSARKYEVCGNHYYHQAQFSDEQIASKVHSWKNEWKYI